MKSRLFSAGLLLTLSASILCGCGLIPTGSTEVVTVITTDVTPEGTVDMEYVNALNAVLAYLSERYGEQAPPPGLAWTGENVTPDRIVGSLDFKYTAQDGDWVARISRPVVAPEAVVYKVFLYSRTGGFYWQGEVDADGQVTEPRVNLVEEMGLSGIMKVKVVEFDLASDSATRGQYIDRLTLTEPQLLNEIVTALDTDLRVAPKVACIPEYQLHFHLADGTVQELEYSCGGATFLRGKQDFWQGEDFFPPEQFDALIQAQLASTLPSQVNVAEQAGLTRTVKIEILETIHSEVTGSPGVVEAQVPELRLTIVDSQIIEQIVAALDADIPLGPRARVPASFILQFHLDDGTVQTFGYVGDSESPAFLSGGQGFWRGQQGEPPAEFDRLLQEQLASTGTLSVSELLENPVYDTEIRVHGQVSLLGELFCPCFELTSGGKKVQVWYDLMVEDDGTESPAVSVEGIQNGDQVVVTGELKTAGAHTSPNDFWASKIEKAQ